ncbi:N-acetylmuramoyl-L-alanine amidase [Nocardia sp. XZ_19_231]|uniref:N-acetylmuramoyl-L-alanine amidase n=1 Tax=Nocardia sp. XZ_19_231 TaxID=2769252 RepID=UPI00351C601C
MVAAPVAAAFLGDAGQYSVSNDSDSDGFAKTTTTQVGLAGAPTVVVPLRELAEMQLPDLRVGDLRLVPGASPLPTGSATGPIGLIAAGASESVTSTTPALNPGVVPEQLADRVGPEVKELTHQSRFSMIGLTAPDLEGTTIRVRARQLDGSWGQWFEAGTDDSVAARPPGQGNMQGSEPIYVGDTDAVQILSTHTPEPSDQPRLQGPSPIAGADHLGSAGPELTAVLLDPGHGEEESSVVAAPPGNGGPPVISRGQWGADESIRCEDPTYDDGLAGVIVHHTAGRNDYTIAESAAIVRGIYAYHSETLGWCDIGYNALVDKYGQIYEGHFGGLDRPVQGAHAGGFNQNTAGVAFMGNHESEEPTPAAVTAMAQIIGWRTRIAGLDPHGTTTMISEGTEFTPFEQGEQVQLPVVFSHRDVGNTACAGDAAYALLDRIRDLAADFNSGAAPKQMVDGQDSTTSALAQPDPDASTLQAMTAKLLALGDSNVLARQWIEAGGPRGRLGPAASEPKPTDDGGQYAQFVNGYLYQAAEGRIFEVGGRIGQRYSQLGGHRGVLGAPRSNEYPVQAGVRVDFAHGSLVFDQRTQIVTTLGPRPGSDQMTPEPTSAPRVAVTTPPVS